MVVLIELALSKWQKVFQMKHIKNHICKWMSFAISTFIIIKEMPSPQVRSQS